MVKEILKIKTHDHLWEREEDNSYVCNGVLLNSGVLLLADTNSSLSGV